MPQPHSLHSLVCQVLRLVLLDRLDGLARRGGHAYRRVVLTRQDHWFACTHPHVHPKRNQYLVPEGEAYNGGVTDRHAVFAFDSRRVMLGILPWLALHDNSRREHDKTKRIYSTESALRAYLAAHRVQVRLFQRVMALLYVRLGGHECFPLRRGHGPVPIEPIPGTCNASSSTWLKYPCTTAQRLEPVARMPHLRLHAWPHSHVDFCAYPGRRIRGDGELVWLDASGVWCEGRRQEQDGLVPRVVWPAPRAHRVFERGGQGSGK